MRRLASYGVAVINDQRVPAPEAVFISDHAAEQYRERVKPGLEVAAARTELEQLRSVAQITSAEPDWVNAAKHAPYYLTIGDALVLPLARQGDEWIATTCLAANTYTPTRRSQRRAYKASKASRKRAQRRAGF